MTITAVIITVFIVNAMNHVLKSRQLFHVIEMTLLAIQIVASGGLKSAAVTSRKANRIPYYKIITALNSIIISYFMRMWLF